MFEIRAIRAHFLAFFAGSLVIFSGTGVLADGLEGAMESTVAWLGGVVIWAVVGLVCLPVTLLLRVLLGRLPLPPRKTIIATGAIISFALIPVLHPAMKPSLSLESNAFGLIAVHGVAGLLGGWLWSMVDTGPYNPRS